ncbi:MAG TPA: TIGR03067 domain-containing protein [Vicinamibacterales bacterium]|nr:TIGR03067 domain-containing protein [Vicinamibacterales bacterium]
MAEHLPFRPNLAYLRSQSKKQLVELKKRNPRAKLADAQLAVARASGFKNWPALARHVEHLRLLEGEWRFVGLQIDGDEMPAAAFGQSRLKMDGDRFRMESPEATYDGVFTIDASADPMRIDIEFVDGPEAGNQSYGIFGQDGDTLTLCLGLAGAPRPKGFSTKKGSGHALERLRRLVAGRPANVTGGTRTAKAGASQPARAAAPVDVKGFDGVVTPLLEKLQGEWAATELVTDGQPMKAEWLAFGSRTTDGNEMKVVFGGQVMAHVKMRFDECASPIAVDYLNLSGAAKGKISTGIFEWAGGEAVFLIAAAGQPRPKDFAAKGKGLTLSRWRKKA